MILRAQKRQCFLERVVVPLGNQKRTGKLPSTAIEISSVINVTKRVTNALNALAGGNKGERDSGDSARAAASVSTKDNSEVLWMARVYVLLE